MFPSLAALHSQLLTATPHPCHRCIARVARSTSNRGLAPGSMVSTVGPPTPPGLIASSPTARANQRCSRWGKCGWSTRRRTRKSSIDAVKRGVFLRYRSRPPCPIVTNT